jgi:hypothetical protein
MLKFQLYPRHLMTLNRDHSAIVTADHVRGRLTLKSLSQQNKVVDKNKLHNVIAPQLQPKNRL